MNAHDATTTYNEIPYVSVPFAQTHPNRTAMVARLFGVQPPSTRRYRYLELGCSRGDNLIPLACSAPDASFVGVDLSTRQIEDARAQARAVGANNVEFRAADLMEVGPELGEFDYIVAHGLYSWVPPAVQERVLELSARHLARNGIAYVSYNTLPGWHHKQIVRDLTRFITRHAEGNAERLKYGLAAVDFMVQAFPKDAKLANGMTHFEPFRTLKKMFDDIPGSRNYFFHEYMETFNAPVYFEEFVERAARHGLGFLAEAEVDYMFPTQFSQATLDVLRAGDTRADVIRREQVLDFLYNRPFRQTLLCHASVEVAIHPDPDQMRFLCLASPLKRSPAADPSAGAVFTVPSGDEVRPTDPRSEAALDYLQSIYPRAAPYREVLEMANSAVEEHARGDSRANRELTEGLFRLFLAGHLELHAEPPAFATHVSERPVAGAWARMRGRAGAIVTSQRHEAIQLGGYMRELIALLDGSRTVGQVVDALVSTIAAGGLVVPEEAQPIVDPARIRRMVEEHIDADLAHLAGSAVLVA